jgi:hypothetical protein
MQRCKACDAINSLELLTSYHSKCKKALNEEKYAVCLKAIEATQVELRKMIKQHFEFESRIEFEMIDLVKRREINVGPTQQKLQTVPYKTGRDAVDSDSRPTKKTRKSKVK